MTAAENTFTPTGTEARTGERAIGKYRPIALLGEGGMARVYLAVMKGPGGFTKLLVIKSLRESLEDPLYLRSFMFEARLAAQLNHPNVVQTFEVGEEAGRYFIAMEYLEGQSLRTVQRRLAPERLPLPMQLRILAEVARGLHHAHTLVSFDGTPLEIVHRDVSPQNVLITYEGQVKLLDFGIAKAQGGGDLTKTGMIKGKIDYIAPEQILGESVDQRADIFSLGVMLWEAITGKRFSGGAEVADVTKIHNRVSGREPKLRDVAPDTPIRLAEICERAVAPRAEDRYDTAEDFALALTDYLRGTSHMPSARDLADVVGPLFASERKKIRKVIDEQVRLIGAGKPEQELGVVDRLPRVSGGERSSTSVGHSGATLGSGISDVANAWDGAGAAQSGKRSSGVRSLGVALLLVLGAGLGGFLAVRGGDDGTLDLPSAQTATEPPPVPIPATVEPAPVVAPPPVEAVVPASIALRITTIPSRTEAILDGVTVPMPLARIVPRDEEPHRLEVRAEGYEPLIRTLSFERDQDITLALEPIPLAEAERPSRTRRAGGAATATAASTEAAPTHAAEAEPTSDSPEIEAPSPRRRIHLDTDNPYAQ